MIEWAPWRSIVAIEIIFPDKDDFIRGSLNEILGKSRTRSIFIDAKKFHGNLG